MPPSNYPTSPFPTRSASIFRAPGRFANGAKGVALMVGALLVFAATAPFTFGESPSTEAGARDYSPSSLAYVLQADKLAKTRSEAVDVFVGCDRDLIIMDGSLYGDAASRWTPGELDRIRAGKVGRRIVAYFSVGEAENYRSYWDASWETSPPAFLLEENPDWEGNFRVKYWSKEWQAIILKECDKLIAQGFDGVYLDIVDAFERFEYDQENDEWIDDRPNAETGNTYREDMVAWVRRIGDHSREKRPGFLVYPQNGEQLLANANYRAAVDGIGVEDLFTNGRRATDDETVNFRIGYLDRLSADGKPVLSIDYSTTEELNAEVRQKAAAKAYVLLITDRDLKTLGESGAGGGGAP